MKYIILFASNNIGKFKELEESFRIEGIDLIMSEEKMELPEPSGILRENAYTKAVAASKLNGNIMALGDDSGIAIHFLDYWPLASSRRWAGKEEEDNLRNQKILEMLSGTEDRDVELISRFALVSGEKKLLETCVRNNFNVSKEIKGKNGFGYDPILEYSSSSLKIKKTDRRVPEIKKHFKTTEINGEIFITRDGMSFPTVAEMNQEQKNLLNNRGRIAAEIRSFLDGGLNV